MAGSTDIDTDDDSRDGSARWTVQSWVLALNRYKRSTVVGREMGPLLSIKTDSNLVTVVKKRVQRRVEVEYGAASALCESPNRQRDQRRPVAYQAMRARG